MTTTTLNLIAELLNLLFPAIWAAPSRAQRTRRIRRVRRIGNEFIITWN